MKDLDPMGKICAAIGIIGGIIAILVQFKVFFICC